MCTYTVRSWGLFYSFFHGRWQGIFSWSSYTSDCLLTCHSHGQKARRACPHPEGQTRTPTAPFDYKNKQQSEPGSNPGRTRRVPPPLPSTTTLSRRHVHSLTVHVQQKTDRGWAWLGLLKVTCDSSNVRLKGRVLKVIEVVCD